MTAYLTDLSLRKHNKSLPRYACSKTIAMLTRLIQKLLSVDGVFPLSPDSSAYKLSLPIFLLHRGTPEARNFRKQLTRRLSDNRAVFDAQIKGVSSELH